MPLFKACILIFMLSLLPITEAHADTAPIIKECWDKSKSNIDAAACLSQALSDLNIKMQSEYESAQSRAKDGDDIISNTVHGKEMPEEEKLSNLLAKSQALFLQYRETECHRQRAELDTGSAAGHAELACKIRLTKQRISEFEN